MNLNLQQIAAFFLATIGPLVTLGISEAQIKAALRWILETDEIWESIPKLARAVGPIGDEVLGKIGRVRRRHRQ
jgi:hypothetical protein